MNDDPKWTRIERTVEAPIDAVWRMWTDAEQFKQWYGPNGMSIPMAEMDAAVGGQRKICMSMKTPERSMTMWFTGEYKEVHAPRRLIYTESMCDEAGNILSPQSMGMPEGHPETTEVVVDLSETHGQTTMILTHIGVPADSGGAGGWTQAIEKMVALVQK